LIFVNKLLYVALLEQCALRPDGSLKDASEITWVHDPDDEKPVASGPQLPGKYFTCFI
jgi:hypothetical protein